MALDPVTDEIRRRADIVEIVGSYVALQPAGNERFKACCPFHDEKTPSFYVSRDKGFYKCFGCLDPNELIWTRDGLRAIGDLKAGDFVWTHRANWAPISAVEKKTRTLLEIQTGAFRSDALRLSPDHRCLFVREESALAALPFLYRSSERGVKFKSAYRRFRSKPLTLQEARADELKVGDFWVFPVTPPEKRQSLPLCDANCLAPYKIGKRVKRIESLPINAETAFVYGLYLAEGSTNPRSVRWTFHHDEKELALEVGRVLEVHFGLPSRQFLYPEHNTRELICSKTDLARQFERWFGKGASGKRLPAQALTWPVEIQRALLAGYLCGDGSEHGLAKTVSRELAYGFFALLIACQKPASLSYLPAYTDKTGQSHRESWTFWAREREGRNGFFHEIEGTLYYFSRISRIQKDEQPREVVDITVPGDDSFVTKLGATHNCGKSGDCFRFLMEIEGVTFPEARKNLAERVGVKIPDRREMTPEQREQISEKERLAKVCAAAAHFFREQFSGNGGLLARDYARKRGLSRETVERFSVGYAPDAWDTLKSNLIRKYGFTDDDLIAVGLLIEKKDEKEGLGGMFEENPNKPKRTYDRYRHRLMFPIWDESGRVIAFGGRALEGGQTGNPDAKYINSPETPLFHKSNVLFAWHIARGEVAKNGGVLITEGYMDAIALHEGGFPNTVATLGTALTAQHVALLRRMSPKAVTLCFDGDGAGMRAALRTAPLFAENGLNVRVVRFPDNHDPDTFIREFGRDATQRLIDEAVSLARFRLETVLASHDLNSPEDRALAMKEAAEIINDVSDPFEKEAYENFLTDTLLGLEKPTSRADWEKRRDAMARLVQNELRADEKRFGASERKREIRSELSGKKPDQNGQVRFLSPRFELKKEEQAKEAQDLSEATQSIAAPSDVPSGVVKAEKELLGLLIGQISYRGHVLKGMPLEKWTNETHAEIVSAIKKLPLDAEIAPVEFNELLSSEAQSLVAELMLREGGGFPEIKIVDDWMWRVHLYHNQIAEKETLEMIRGKIERGEKVSAEEKELLMEAMRNTKRKQPIAS